MRVREHLCFSNPTFPTPSSPSSCADESSGAAAVVNEIEEEFLFCISVSLFFYTRKLNSNKQKIRSARVVNVGPAHRYSYVRDRVGGSLPRSRSVCKYLFK